MATTRNEIKEKLIDVIKLAMPNAGFDEKTLDESASLTVDVGLSSVGILYVVIAIEEFFGVRFENVGFDDFHTVGDVIDYIEEKQNA